MGILAAISGLILAVHALALGLCIHLALQYRRDRAATTALLLERGAELYHIGLLVNFTQGFRLTFLQLAVMALVVGLSGLMLGSPVAIYLLAVGIMIDACLFMTCPDRKILMRQTTEVERWLDAGQHFLVLLAFSLLAFRHWTAHH